MADTPTVDDVCHILKETPETMFLTISRRAFAMVNDLAVQALFCDHEALAVIPSDPDSNTEKYERSWKAMSEQKEMAVFMGMRIVPTKNLNKAIGFVNGMGVEVAWTRTATLSSSPSKASTSTCTRGLM
eukprot:2273014-Heterocapsa_arctica.AAC.1